MCWFLTAVSSFGIPPSIKKWLQEEALEYMGENKASYMMNKGVDMLPEADQDVCSLPLLGLIVVLS